MLLCVILKTQRVWTNVTMCYIRGTEGLDKCYSVILVAHRVWTNVTKCYIRGTEGLDKCYYVLY